MALPRRTIFASIAAVILVWGVWDVITNFEENGCEMTWMFEYPKYMVRKCTIALEESNELVTIKY